MNTRLGIRRRFGMHAYSFLFNVFNSLKGIAFGLRLFNILLLQPTQQEVGSRIEIIHSVSPWRRWRLTSIFCLVLWVEKRTAQKLSRVNIINWKTFAVFQFNWTREQLIVAVSLGEQKIVKGKRAWLNYLTVLLPLYHFDNILFTSALSVSLFSWWNNLRRPRRT